MSKILVPCASRTIRLNFSAPVVDEEAEEHGRIPNYPLCGVSEPDDGDTPDLNVAADDAGSAAARPTAHEDRVKLHLHNRRRVNRGTAYSPPMGGAGGLEGAAQSTPSFAQRHTLSASVPCYQVTKASKGADPTNNGSLTGRISKTTDNRVHTVVENERT
ncbi:hypothetical protein ON010_g15334 [Phytophthora cinnamomi]|nr:hypothetical protein ON010_g15334 [Phytophthora cinnamomi]